MNHQLMCRALLVLSLVVLSPVAAACSETPFIESVTVVNETDYPVHIEVSDTSREAWLGLTTGRPDSETVVEKVVDQGEVWVFSFDYAGQHRQEIEVSSAELEQSDWRVKVPASFGEALEEEGIQPPP